MMPSFWSAIWSSASASALATAAADLNVEGIAGPSGRLLNPRTLQPVLNTRHPQIKIAYRIADPPQFPSSVENGPRDQHPACFPK
jgi:hypothetical protein